MSGMKSFPASGTKLINFNEPSQARSGGGNSNFFGGNIPRNQALMAPGWDSIAAFEKEMQHFSTYGTANPSNLSGQGMATSLVT